MDKIRVLHIMPTFHDCSIVRIVYNIVDRLDATEYTFHISAPNAGPMMGEYAKQGASVVAFAPVGLNGRREGFLQTAQNIRKYIKEHDIDIVHAHTPTTTLLAWVALLGNRRVTHMYTKHILTTPRDWPKLGQIFSMVDHLSLYFAHYLIPVSHRLGKQLSAHIGIQESRVRPVQNAIPHDYFYQPQERALCRAEFGFRDEDVVIGFTGRLEKVKQLDLLIDTFAKVHAQYPNVRLLIVGKGSLQAELEAQAVSLGVDDAVIFAGFRTDIPRLLAAMDIYSQVTGNEGLSLSILEAMAAGKVVVASEVGAIHEVIIDDQHGIIITQQQLGEFAQILSQLVASADLRYQIGENARRFIDENFSIRKMTERYDALYKEFASHRLRPHSQLEASQL